MALPVFVFARKLAVLPLKIYKAVISPHLPDACLYHPSCSVYMRDAITRHGIFAGFFAGILRVLRCQGWMYKGGDDPVPEKLTARYLFGSFQTFLKNRRS